MITTLSKDEIVCVSGGTDPWVIVGIVGGSIALLGGVIKCCCMCNRENHGGAEVGENIHLVGENVHRAANVAEAIIGVI